MKKLEYRIIERTKLSVPYCNYCVISDEPVLDNATHELVASMKMVLLQILALFVLIVKKILKTIISLIVSFV